MLPPFIKKRSAALVAAAMLVSCSANSAKSHYVLAEQLWNDGKYAASVAEFEKAQTKDPHGKMGKQALYRAAMTQFLFLSQYSEAVAKFQSYAQLNPGDPSAWEAEKQIGEIYFSKMEQYDQAIRHYQSLLDKNPQAQEAPEFLYRIGRSAFFISQFDRAREAYQQILAKHPESSWAEKATYQIGVTHYTQGEQDPSGRNANRDSYRKAIEAFQEFLKKYPKSPLGPEAKFGIASCQEEMDQLDAAFHGYEALLDTYPSPNVIRIKLARIRDRKAQRSH